MRKILFYHWTDLDDVKKRGGGVSVYQRNVIEQMLKDENNEIYYISSGRQYDLCKRTPYIKEADRQEFSKCKCFYIVNSPVVAPESLAFNEVEKYLNDTQLHELMKKFIITQGGFDVIHFNNLEGLTLKVLELKRMFPNTRFVYSLHNYFPFCPQVNLWRCKTENCRDYHNGSACVECMPKNLIKQKIMRKLSMSCYLEDHYSEALKNQFDSYGEKLDKLYGESPDENMSPDKAAYYANCFCEFRDRNVEYINKYIDTVLAVSERVKQIALDMGIRPDLLHTAYIGTKFAERQKKADAVDSKKPYFTIIYMGYMRKDKGFYFLLNALDQLEKSISKTIDVIFATKITDKNIIDSINNTARKYHSIRIIDGYTHDTLPEILKGVDLGIVPVLWEDNLPQVAIEMAAHGIPVLCSNLGGACELSSSELFQFEGGNQKDFEDKLVYLIEHREQLVDYWSKYRGLKTMNDHIRELYSYYGYNSN